MAGATQSRDPHCHQFKHMPFPTVGVWPEQDLLLPPNQQIPHFIFLAWNYSSALFCPLAVQIPVVWIFWHVTKVC